MVLLGFAPARPFAMDKCPSNSPGKTRKTSLYPGLATFRRAIPPARTDTTDRAAGVLQQRPKKISGRDFDGVFQHDGGLLPGLRVVRDGGRQGLERAGERA